MALFNPNIFNPNLFNTGYEAPPAIIRVGSNVLQPQYWRPRPQPYAQAMPVVGTVVYWSREKVPLYEKEE